MTDDDPRKPKAPRPPLGAPAPEEADRRRFEEERHGGSHPSASTPRLSEEPGGEGESPTVEHSPGAIAPPEAPRPEDRERWRAATRRAVDAAAEAGAGGGGPEGASTPQAGAEAGRAAGVRAASDDGPAPGDLFVHPATARFDVEWLLVARRPGEPERVRLVPAVSEEGRGSGDVEVDEDEAGGPLVLRCRHRLWVPVALLDPELRNGRIPLARAAEAERLCASLDAGPVRGTPLQREMDEDLAYGDRDEELAEAREALFAAATAASGPAFPPVTDSSTEAAPSAPLEPPTPIHGPEAPPISSGPVIADRSSRAGGRDRDGDWRPATPAAPSLGLRLAAGFLLVALGLAAWWGLALRQEVASLRHQVAELEQPTLLSASSALELSTTRSGDDRYLVRRVGPWLVLALDWGTQPLDRPYRIDIVDPEGRVRLTVPVTELPGSASGSTVRHLTIPRRDLPPGPYFLRLVDLSQTPPEVVGEPIIQVPD